MCDLQHKKSHLFLKLIKKIINKNEKEVLVPPA